MALTDNETEIWKLCNEWIYTFARTLLILGLCKTKRNESSHYYFWLYYEQSGTSDFSLAAKAVLLPTRWGIVVDIFRRTMWWVVSYNLSELFIQYYSLYRFARAMHLRVLVAEASSLFKVAPALVGRGATLSACTAVHIADNTIRVRTLFRCCCRLYFWLLQLNTREYRIPQTST